MEYFSFTIPVAAFSTNSFWSNGKRNRFISARGREWRTDIINYLEVTHPEIKNIINPDDRLRVDYRFYFKGKRKRDAFNYEKPLTDTFEDYFLPDDEQIDIGSVTRLYHAKQDGIFAEFTILPKDNPIPYHPIDEYFM